MTRLIILGDELVAGSGDERGLGWVGRAVARTEFTSDTHVLTLAVPGETTSALAERWNREVQLRVPENEQVFAAIGMGVADIPAGISPARTRLNLANVLDGLYNLGISTMLVGPPPLPHIDSESVRELSKIGKEVAGRRNVPWVNTFDPLVNHEQWAREFATSGSTLPTQTCYGLLAWLVLHEGWYDWLAG